MKACTVPMSDGKGGPIKPCGKPATSSVSELYASYNVCERHAQAARKVGHRVQSLKENRSA
jgi:hypothetical protein